MKRFGERLKKLRRDKNITQDTLAEYLGISYQAVSKWENNAGYPDISLLPAIAGFFGVSADYLLGIDQENSESKIEKALQDAQKFTHIGEIEKSIHIIEEALKSFPNDHRLLCDLIKYKLMRPRKDQEWIEDIEQKADLILRDCHIDKIRHQTIGNLTKAYALIGKKEKVVEVAQQLPDFAYSKTLLLSDILTTANYHIFRGDPAIAVDICKNALTMINSLGTEGYWLYIQLRFQIHLVLAYGKLQNTELMYIAAETALEICITIEKTLTLGETEYVSPPLAGLIISKDNLKAADKQNTLERYYSILIHSQILNIYAEEERYKSLLKRLKEEIEKYRRN